MKFSNAVGIDIYKSIFDLTIYSNQYYRRFKNPNRGSKQMIKQKSRYKKMEGWQSSKHSPFIFLNVIAGIGLVILGIICFIIHFITPVYSTKGREIHHDLKGLRLFLEAPDPDVLDDLLMQNDQYLNELFPYALAFGLDKNWTQRFNNLFVKPPAWYDHGENLEGQGIPSFGGFTGYFNPYLIEKAMYSIQGANLDLIHS